MRKTTCFSALFSDKCIQSWAPTKLSHFVVTLQEEDPVSCVENPSKADDGVLGSSTASKAPFKSTRSRCRLQQKEEEDVCCFRLQQKEKEDVCCFEVGHGGNAEEVTDSPPVSLQFLLKTCAGKKDLRRGSYIHSHIARKGLLEGSASLGTALVNMYAKCGALAKAQEVFDQLVEKNVIVWNALISGYSQEGLDKAALCCFEQLRCEGLCPDGVTFTLVLKASGCTRALDKGQEAHGQVVAFGFLDSDVFVGTALVDMYTKCGSLEEAQDVFDKLPNQNLITWNVLIAGFAKHGYGREALECYERMRLRGLRATAATFSSLLKCCSIIGALDKGLELHASIVRDGLLQTEKVACAVVDMYIKCGMLGQAEEVFNELLVRNEVVWNALINGFAQEEHGEEALKLFTRMQCEALCPDAITYACIFKGSCSLGSVDKAIEIHARVVDGLLEKEIDVGTSLVDLYAKFGLMEHAQEVFERLLDHNVVSWTALIWGYAQLGHCKEALNCYARMQVGGLYPNAATFSCLLKACGGIGAAVEGQEIHAQIVRSGLLAEEKVGTALLDMYTRCGMLGKALEVFEELPDQDIIAWNRLIAGYMQLGNCEKALECFEKLQGRGISPNIVTMCCILKVCSSLGAANKFNCIVARILEDGCLRKDGAGIANALLKTLVDCGLLAKAQEVFDELPIRDEIAWNTLLTGYVQHGHDDEAFACFEQMKGERASQGAITFSCILKACGRVEAGDKGKQIHAQILQERTLLGREVVVGTSLVDMYCKCGMLAEAQKVFDELPMQDVVLWNALMTGYAQQGHCEEALDCFESMQVGGFMPDLGTFSCILKVCGHLGAVYKGQVVHDRILRGGFLQGQIVLGNTMVDMYANCGMVSEAQNMFNRLAGQDIVSWNSLIAGYAQRGETENTFSFFDRMVVEGQNPDSITFTHLLHACSHAGLLDRSQRILESMSSSYGMTPNLGHLNCIVDCLGRAGCLDKVVDILDEMPFPANLLMWHTVLGACQNHSNFELGRWAFENAVLLDEDDVGAFVCMYNILAAAEGSNQAVSMTNTMRISRGNILKNI